LQVFCFKQNLSIKDFVDVVHQLRSTANSLGVALESLPSYIKQLEGRVHRLTKEIEEKRSDKQEALEDCDVTLEKLEEYIDDRPFFETNQKLKEQLDKVTREQDRYKQFTTEIENERFGREIEEYNNLTIPEEQLDEANDKLGLGGLTPMAQRSDVDKLYEIAMQIYHWPSEHVDIIRQLMKTTPEFRISSKLI
jgi:chromosome segregation ATPase